jgi:hypothetical protein
VALVIAFHVNETVPAPPVAAVNVGVPSFTTLLFPHPSDIEIVPEVLPKRALTAVSFILIAVLLAKPNSILTCDNEILFGETGNVIT